MATPKSLKERLANQRKALADRSAGGNFMTIKEGTTRIRHLPAPPEKEFVIEAVYFYLGDKIKGVVSPRTIGKKCAIMEAYELLSKSKKAEEREWATKFKPSKKFFSPAIKYKDEDGKEVDMETGVKMLQLTPGLYQDILDLYLDEKEAGDFTDPVNGYDIKYKRTGKGKQDTEYNIIKCKETKLDVKFTKQFKADPNAYDPEVLIKGMIPTYEETKAKIEEFLSLPPEEDVQDAPEKTVKKKKKKKSTDL